MKLGIIGATEGEINPLINQIHNLTITKHALHTFMEGSIGDVKVVIVLCGIGKFNATIATQMVIDIFHVTHIVNIGVAGAIDETLHIRDTIVSSQVTYHDVADDVLITYQSYLKGVYLHADAKMLYEIIEANFDDPSIYVGKIVSGEGAITELGRNEIKNKYHPLCVDMETASIAHVCYVNAIPFVAIRSISHMLESEGDVFGKDYQKASEKSVNITLQFINSK